MRILFVTDVFRSWHGSEPLGIMYLSSVLTQRGHETAIAASDFREIVGVTSQFRPDVYAYSLATGNQPGFIELAKRVKASFGGYHVFGGPHPTFFPEMIEEDCVDAVCRGEGEEAVPEFVDRLAEGDDVSHVQNWWVRNSATEEISRNAVRPLIEDLDGIPFPDRELVYDRFSRPKLYGIARFITSRGCPYDCAYCSNHAYRELYKGRGKPIRLRSVDNVLEEIQDVRRRHPLKFIQFVDDLFILSNKWLDEFCEKYPSRVGLPFWCNVRANLVTPEIVRKLKSAGCHSVCFAIETGNEQLRNQILNRDITDEQLIETSRLFREAGIRYSINSIMGIPGETTDTALETLKLNIKCKPDLASVMLFVPFPRTRLTEIAKERGLYEGDEVNVREAVSTFGYTSYLKLEDMHEIANLQRLASITVEFPFLLPLVRPLSRLPLGKLYDLIRRIWTGYGQFRIYNIRISLRYSFRAVLGVFQASQH